MVPSFIKELPGFIFGMLIGVIIQQTFNFPISYYFGYQIGPNTLVKHIPDQFYSFCEYGQIIYIKNINTILVEWKNCENHPIKEFRDGMIEIHNINQLERIK